jgi:hypothetical protein
MNAQLTKRSQVVRHRANLKLLVDRLEKKPFDYLPERSVECLNQFFSGYQFFGPAIWRDLTSFQFWLKKRLAYPEDSSSCWWRFIQLNSKDRYDSFDLFCRFYRQYRKQKPIDVQPSAPESKLESDSFDFYQYLYAISKKPGLIIGSSDDVQLLASHLAGYFSGKKHSGIGLTRDEKEFHRFGKWLSRRHKLQREYPWHRMVEMWLGARGSFQSFFVEYDAFLTNYGKKVGGFEDLFEIVSKGGSTRYRRRKKLPKEIVRIPGSQMWWRSPANQ